MFIINQELLNEKFYPPSTAIFEKSMCDEENWMFFVDFCVEDCKRVVDVEDDWVFAMTRECCEFYVKDYRTEGAKR